MSAALWCSKLLLRLKMLPLRCRQQTHILQFLLCTQACPPCLLLFHTSRRPPPPLSLPLFLSLSDSDSNDGEQGKDVSMATYHKAPLHPTPAPAQSPDLDQVFLSFFKIICVFTATKCFSFSVLHPSFPQNVCFIKNKV